MKVLFVLEDLLVGGAQRHTLDLAAALRGRFDCAVLTLADRAATTLPHEAEACVRWLDLRPLHPASWRRIARALDEAEPDLIVTVNPVATLAVAAARPLCVRRPRRAVVFHTTRIASAQGWARALPFIPVTRGCDALVYVSATQRRLWEGRGLRARQVRTMPNGVQPDRYAPATPWERTQARAALGWSEGDFVFGLAAILRREKNAVQLVDALAALRAAGAPARLLVIGDGPSRAAVQARAEALGLAASLHVTGEQPNIRPWLAALDVGALTSTAVETLSLFALEAMASGLPMVMSDIGGAREIVTPGEDGFLFPAGDTPAMAAALDTLRDREARRRMGMAARATVAARFDHARMVNAYADLFEGLIASR